MVDVKVGAFDPNAPLFTAKVDVGWAGSHCGPQSGSLVLNPQDLCS